MGALWDQTIAEAGAGLRRGDFSAGELTRAVLARLEATEPAVHAYITVTAERALAEARGAEARFAAGTPLGSLDGIPVGYKDVFDTAGVRTTAGSRLLAGRVPATDATAVARLQTAGAVMLGKHNTHEFAMGATTLTYFGATRNPWDLARIAGGSSGGSAAAVAAGSALGALGSDTGGSIRFPAALCGVAGLKPTYGRVSRAGVYPMSWSLDHAGPIARTAEDCAVLLQAIAGHDPRDPGSSPAPIPDYTTGPGASPRGRRLGLARELAEDELPPEVARIWQEALATLRDLGFTLREVSIGTAARAHHISSPIVLSENADLHADWTPEQAALLGEDVRRRLATGRLYTGAQYVRAQRARAAVRHDLRAALAEVDAIVTPLRPGVAPRADNIEELARMSPYLAIFNVSGFPALVVPAGFSAEGLPVGLQIGGGPFAEATVLAIGHAYERATEWYRRRPPLMLS
jgi:aspartyl-tRNA(Asn)/glutamyl-tRNA(Gln) amidotransferase subunit A